MRHQINNYAKLFIRLNSNKMTIIEKFRTLINDSNNHLKNIIIKKTVNFHDIRVYSNATNFELKVMMTNFNEQTLFFTISATNLQWRDLYKHMSNVAQINDIIEIIRNRLTWRLLKKKISHCNRIFLLSINFVFKNNLQN